MYHPAMPCLFMQSRGNIGMVLYNENGGCLLCSINTTELTHCSTLRSIRESHIHKMTYYKGILLPAIMLTHVLDADDSFPYWVTRLVAPYEGTRQLDGVYNTCELHVDVWSQARVILCHLRRHL